jgi:hypothetical protein
MDLPDKSDSVGRLRGSEVGTWCSNSDSKLCRAEPSPGCGSACGKIAISCFQNRVDFCFFFVYDASEDCFDGWPAEIVRRPPQSFTGESCIETSTSGSNSVLFHC